MDSAARAHEGQSRAPGTAVDRALEVLAEAAELSDSSSLVFPGTRPGRPLSENTHAKLLRELGSTP